MVRPADRRRVAEWAGDAYQVSERRACAVIGVARSAFRYQPRRSSHECLRLRLRELAGVRTYAGYRRLHTYLRREGWKINHKLVYRLYREEGLSLRRKQPRRRRSAVTREARPELTEANQYWSMDFMHDALIDGRTLRIFTLIDVHTRECLALGQQRTSAVQRSHRSSLESARIVHCLTDPGGQRDGVHIEGAGRLGLLEQGQARFFTSRQTRRQCPHRGLQQPGSARVSIATLV